MTILLSQPFQPFAVALMVLLGLIVIEVISLLLGASIAGGLEELGGLKGLEHFSLLETSLGWLNVGRVPLLALLMVVLGLFSSFGIIIQMVAISFYTPLPSWVAAIISLFFALPVARLSSRVLAKIIPQDETYATTADHFIGRTGVVSLGPVKTGFVARIKIQDEWKNWHFPRACPSEPDEEIPEGETVLVVDVRGNEMVVTKASSLLTE